MADPLDYATLAHAVSVTSLRAGAHDDSGTNEYFFAAKMYGLLNSADERNATLDKRKKIEVDLGTFGETQIVSLGFWRAEGKASVPKELKIDGNQIRELTARVMQEHKVTEAEVAIMMELTMLEKNKKYWFFGEDTKIGSVTYYPVPATKFDTPLATNSELTLTDDKGTLVKLVVTYDKQVGAATKAATPP